MLAGNPNVRRCIEAQHRHGIVSYLECFIRQALRYDLAISARPSDRQVLFARVAGRRAVSFVQSQKGR